MKYLITLTREAYKATCFVLDLEVIFGMVCKIIFWIIAFVLVMEIPLANEGVTLLLIPGPVVSSRGEIWLIDVTNDSTFFSNGGF